MPTRDFDAMLAEKTGSGRPEFVVAGQHFTARSKLAWAKFLMLSNFDEGMDEGEAVQKFFRTVLLPSHRQRFLDLLNAGAEDDDEDDDDESCIDPQQVNEITDWLMAYYTGKANPNASSSSDGHASTGQPSKVVSLTPRTNSA